MKTLKVLAAASALSAILALGASTSAVAGSHEQGFGPQGFGNNPNTVAAVKRDAYDDQYVTLRGRLVGFLGHDRYEFADQTGSIEVELDDDYNWSHIAKDQLIEITGEVDRDFFSTTIDVRRAVPLERGVPAPMPAVAPQAPATPQAPAAPVAQ